MPVAQAVPVVLQLTVLPATATTPQQPPMAALRAVRLKVLAVQSGLQVAKVVKAAAAVLVTAASAALETAQSVDWVVRVAW
jgi:hypothetical protein